MDEQIEGRLAELRDELRKGEEMLAELQQRQAALRDTLLRIHGAIQVLEELRGPRGGESQDPPAPVIALA
jgi:prefoldin subunit 5